MRRYASLALFITHIPSRDRWVSTAHAHSPEWHHSLTRPASTAGRHAHDVRSHTHHTQRALTEPTRALSAAQTPINAYHGHASSPVSKKHPAPHDVLRTYHESLQGRLRQGWTSGRTTAAPSQADKTASPALLVRVAHHAWAGLNRAVALIEAPSLFIFSVVKHTLRITVLLAISTLELAGEVYRSVMHPYTIRVLRFAIGTPFLCGLAFLLAMRYWYFPEPSMELDTSSVVARLRYGGSAVGARPAEPNILRHVTAPSGQPSALAQSEAGVAEPRLCRTADELLSYTQALRQGYRGLLMRDHKRRLRRSRSESGAPAQQAQAGTETEAAAEGVEQRVQLESTSAAAADDATPAEASTVASEDAGTSSAQHEPTQPPPQSTSPHAVLASHDPADALTLQQRNDLLHDVLWAIRSLEENIMNTDEERAFVTPRADLLRAPPQGWPGHSGVAAAAIRETSPAEFTLRVLLSVSIEQGWFDVVERVRRLFGELVHNRPLPLQASVARAVGDLCVLSYEMDVPPPLRAGMHVDAAEDFLSGVGGSLDRHTHEADAVASSSSPTSSSTARAWSWLPSWGVHALSYITGDSHADPDASALAFPSEETLEATQRHYMKITTEQKRRVARAIDTFRPERAVEERPTIASEISLMPIQDGEQTTRCVGLIRHSAGRRPQLVLVFVGSNTLSNWVTNLDYRTVPLPAQFGVRGPPAAESSPPRRDVWGRVRAWWRPQPTPRAASAVPMDTESVFVHRGFYDLVTTIPYKDMAKEFDHIIIVGHSLGGALAQLAGLELAAERPSRRITVMTMASPRILAVEPNAYAAFLAQQEGQHTDSDSPSRAGEGPRRLSTAGREDPIAEALSLPPNYRHIRGFLRPDAVPQLPPERLCYTHTGRPLPLQTGCQSFASFIGTGMASKLFHSAVLYWQLLNQQELAIAQTHSFNPALSDDGNDQADGIEDTHRDAAMNFSWN